MSSGCTRSNDDEEGCPFPPHPSFTLLPEDNAGNRIRTVTCVYDRTVADNTYPPKIDSSTLLFSYDATGKIDTVRLIHNGLFFTYDFAFERRNNKLMAIHARGWSDSCGPELVKIDLDLVYDGSGKVSLLKTSFPSDLSAKSDSFIIKSTGNRVDTVIDRKFAVGADARKFVFKYDGSGDIVQMDQIQTSGVFTVLERMFKYTLSGVPAPSVWGDEAIWWYFFANYCDVSSNTDFMIPPVFFHSMKQPSRFDIQVSGFYTAASNYLLEYYSSGRLKKSAAPVITSTGALYAREAYYYTYSQ